MRNGSCMIKFAIAAGKRRHQILVRAWRAHCVAAACAASLASACGQGERDVTHVLEALPSVRSAEAAPDAARSTATETPIVFTSDRAEPGVLDLYLMALDGTNVKRLTWGRSHFWPQWSPDGETIAFRTGGQNAEVGLVASDGGPLVLLTQGEASYHWRMPVNWSPDGEWLAYAAGRVAPDETFVSVISRFGGQQRRLLTNIRGEQDTATWSWASGSRIVYSEYEGERNKDLWLIESADAAEALNLTQGRVFAPGLPQWSPDGSRIAFHAYARLPDGNIEGFGSHGEGGATPPDPEIFLIDVESRELTRLTDNTWHDYRPAWSPDGTSLLIESAQDGDNDLWLMPLDAPLLARNLINDTALPHEDSNPAWYAGPR